MKKKISIIITAAIIGCLCFFVSQASAAKFTAPKAVTDTTHAMLRPDSNTIYLDTAGNKIAGKQFMANMQTGKYTFVPEVKDGKIFSIKLKAADKTVSIGSMAPEFSGTDLNGHAVDLKTLKGKTVILNFWFTSCAPCMQEMPELNGLVDKYKNDNSVVFLAVTYESPEMVKSFLKRKDFKFNILAGRSDIIKQFGINGYPTSMVINKTGSLVFTLATYDGTNVQQLDGVITALKGAN